MAHNQDMLKPLIYKENRTCYINGKQAKTDSSPSSRTINPLKSSDFEGFILLMWEKCGIFTEN